MRDKLIDRVKKMLAKADPKSNNFEAEMNTAAEMAKTLIADHKITQAELDGRDNLNKEGLAEKEAYFGKLPDWAEHLVVVVEKLTGTRAIIQHRQSDPSNKKVSYIGSNLTVDIAIELFNKFFWIITDRAALVGALVPRPPFDLVSMLNNAAFGQSSAPINKMESFNSYALGFVHKLMVRAERKVKMESPEAQQKYELMVVRETAAIVEYIKAKYNPPKTKEPPVNYGDKEAYVKGYMDAENESLNVHKTIK